MTTQNNIKVCPNPECGALNQPHCRRCSTCYFQLATPDPTKMPDPVKPSTRIKPIDITGQTIDLVEFALKAHNLMQQSKFFDVNEKPQEGTKLVEEAEAAIQQIILEARIDELDHTEVNTLSSLPGVMTFVATFGGQSKAKRLADLRAQLATPPEQKGNI